VGGRRVELANKEFALLRALTAEPTRVFTTTHGDRLRLDVGGPWSVAYVRVLATRGSRMWNFSHMPLLAIRGARHEFGDQRELSASKPWPAILPWQTRKHRAVDSLWEPER
jgi:hypothetical protein